MIKEKVLLACVSAGQAAFGERLLAVVLYGSAAVQDFVPGSSDVNILLLVQDIDQTILSQARAWRKKLARHRVAAPLLLTPDFIRRSADVFPIEFFEIKEKHRVLWGADPMLNLKIEPTNLRHECEHELKGRLLRMRQSFMELDRSAALRSLLLAAHNSNFPAFRTALRLAGIQPPVKKEEVLAGLANRFSLDLEVFEEIQRLRLAKRRQTQDQLECSFENYCHEVEKLALAVDEL